MRLHVWPRHCRVTAIDEDETDLRLLSRQQDSVYLDALGVAHAKVILLPSCQREDVCRHGYLKQGRQGFGAFMEGGVDGQLQPRCAVHGVLHADAIGQVDQLISDKLACPLNPPP